MKKIKIRFSCCLANIKISHSTEKEEEGREGYFSILFRIFCNSLAKCLLV